MNDGIVSIDGRTVALRSGETILAAARRAGIDIPTLCHHPALPPEGGCRLCLVEIDGARRPVAACHTLCRPGMIVRTDSPRLRALRRDILSLILDQRPALWRFEDAAGELAALAARLGLAPRGEAAPMLSPPPDGPPQPRYDSARCILCRRCLGVCERIQGQFVYGVAGRGAAARLIVGVDDRFDTSGCVACGGCVETCPTGALTDRDRVMAGPTDREVDTVCGYCGVGCRVRAVVRDERVARIDGVPDAVVNRGHLCVKGRYSHRWQSHPDRLTTPLLRRGDSFEPLSWPAAIAWLADRLTRIRDQRGPDALGLFASARSTNEAAYLMQKLFRAVLGTNNVDCCARVCHSSTALALQTVTGAGAATASYADIERARCLFLAGANPTEAHPVVGARLKQAALAGTPLIVADPRAIELAIYATVHLAVRPGANVALFNALAKALLEDGLIDEDYLAERVDGFAELSRFLHELSFDAAARTAGVEPAQVRAAARLLGERGPTLFVHGLGLSELVQGTASVMALCNLGLLTGSIGRPGAGMLPLRGQNNVQGAADMGAMPNQVTGYQRLDDEAVRSRLARLWGAPPPPQPGLTTTVMLAAAGAGALAGLWISGEDVVRSEPRSDEIEQALGRLDLLVVQDLFLTATARHAHLVLPAAGYLEQDGTFTNGERRIQRVRPAVPPPRGARPDWEVAVDVANALGAGWRYPSPAAVMDEIAEAAPTLFGGVRYDRLEPDGLQWPCPHPQHPGTATVHADGFLRGRAQLVAIDHSPNPEHDVEGYPWLLITGRVLEHYNAGEMTGRDPERDPTAVDRLELHPEDLARLAVNDGEEVLVESRWGRAVLPAYGSRRVAPGTLFLSFHFAGTGANRLVGPHVDPQSKCPQYKVTAVRVQRA